MKQIAIAISIVLILGTVAFSQEAEETGVATREQMETDLLQESPIFRPYTEASQPEPVFNFLTRMQSGISLNSGLLVFVAVLNVAILVLLIVIIAKRKV